MVENTKLHWGFKVFWAVALTIGVGYLLFGQIAIVGAIEKQNTLLLGNKEGLKPLSPDLDSENASNLSLYDWAGRGAAAHDYLQNEGVLGRGKEIREFFNTWLVTVDKDVYEQYSTNGEEVPLCLSNEVNTNLGKLDFEVNRQAFVLDFYGKRQLWFMHDTPTIQCYYLNKDSIMQSIACDKVCDDRLFDTNSTVIPPNVTPADALQITSGVA